MKNTDKQAIKLWEILQIQFGTGLDSGDRPSILKRVKDTSELEVGDKVIVFTAINDFIYYSYKKPAYEIIKKDSWGAYVASNIKIRIDDGHYSISKDGLVHKYTQKHIFKVIFNAYTPSVTKKKLWVLDD